MAGILTGLGVAANIAKILAPAIGVAAVMAVGWGARTVYDAEAPWGYAHQVAGQHQLAVTNATNWRLMKADRDAWQAADVRAEAQRRADAKQAAIDLQAASDTQTKASSDAFDQGVAFGRAAASKTCGAPNAPTSFGVSDSASNSQSGGVRNAGPDFAADWQRGAYVPGASLPSQP